MATHKATRVSSSPYRLANVRSALGHYLVGRSAGAIASLFSAVLLVRHMSVADYAGYTALFGVAGITTMFSSLGLERAVTRFVPEGLLQHPGALPRFVWRILGLRFASVILITAVLGLVWPRVIALFEYAAAPTIPVPLVVWLLATTCVSLLSIVLQALVRQKLLTQINVIQWMGRLAWILWFVYRGQSIDLHQALWIMAVPELCAALVLVPAVAIALRVDVMAPAQLATDRAGAWPEWRSVARLSGHSYAFNVLASLPQGYFMRTLVAATLPVEIVAAYGFFSNLVDRFRAYLPLQLMYNLVEPVLVARYVETGDKRALIHHAQLLLKMNILLLVAATIFVLIGGAAFTHLLTGGKFAEYSWILILLVAQTISGSHIVTLQLIANTLRVNDCMSRAGAVALVVLIVFLAGTLVSGGQLIIIFGTLLYSVVSNVSALWLMFRKPIPYTFVWPGSGSFLVTGILIIIVFQLIQIFSPLSDIWSRLSIAFIASLLFLALAYRVTMLKDTDMRFVLNRLLHKVAI